MSFSIQWMIKRLAGGGMRSLYDSELRWQWEQNAYGKEIAFMKSMGYHHVVKQLQANMAAERAKIFGETVQD